MTPSGRMPEYHKLKASTAELTLQEKYENTRKMSNVSRASDRVSNMSDASGRRNRGGNGYGDDDEDDDEDPFRS